jgi:hypothetical protein
MPTTVIAPSTATETCTEVRLKVMIFSPEAGFKFDVTVQKKCFPTKWLIIFNLFKKKPNSTDFDQIVGVEFEAEKKEEEKAIETMSVAGVNVLQARAFRKKVFPRVKAGDDPSKIHNEISKAALQ